MKKLILTIIVLSSILTTINGQLALEYFSGNRIYNSQEDYPQVDYKHSKSYCDTIYSFPVIEDNSSGLAWDGNFYWTSAYDKSVINKIDTLGNILGSFTLPSSSLGGSIGFDGTYLLSAVEDEGTLYKIDPNTELIVQQYDLPTPTYDPNILGITYDGQHIWCVYHHPSRLYKLNPEDGLILDSMNLASSINAIEWINGKLYGINSYFNPTNYLYTINTTNGSYIDSVDWCLEYISDLSWDGNNLWCISSLYTPEFKVYKMGISFSPTTGIAEEIYSYSKTVSIYPNPTSDKITIDAENICKVELINLKGKSIPISRTENEIDLRKQPKGIYFLRITTEFGVINKKIIKE